MRVLNTMIYGGRDDFCDLLTIYGGAFRDLRETPLHNLLLSNGYLSLEVGGFLQLGRLSI